MSTRLSEADTKLHDSSISSSYKHYLHITHCAQKEEVQAQAYDESSKALMNQITSLAVETEPANPVVQMLLEAHGDSLQERDNHLAKAKAFWTSRNSALKPGQGPLSGVLDTTLKSIRVCRQAYHGKSFIGNHVHKCCKPENIELLTSSITRTAELLCPSIVPEVKKVAAKYHLLFSKFAECHNVYNTNIMTDATIDKLEQDITSYCEYFRSEFQSETIPPKFHMLDEHTVPFIRKWHFGLGFLGEQGGRESMLV
ncbi:uncharacterized protein [Asterias amurensis]|uniref:uncharacterized protein n=1 Tax=Asterias amurensis TaxID=7602 RepID=UPI003AB8AFAE